MLVCILNQTKLVAFVNYRRLEIKLKLGKLGSYIYIYIAYFLTHFSKEINAWLVV